jgi:hypothetical protein
LRTVASQHQIEKAKRQVKNKWKVDSTLELQREHLEGRQHPLSISLSSVGTLSSINLHTKRDFEGGISLHQMILAQDFLGDFTLLNS